MAQSFIGKIISLISQSDVRYRGVLVGVDTQQSTIQLSNVYSMGTEDRRPSQAYIPPNMDPYEYIVFRAAEVKHIALEEEQPPQMHVTQDPAILDVSAQYRQSPLRQQPMPTNGMAQPYTDQPSQAIPPLRQPQGPHKSGSVDSATTSMQNVEKALGDLRVSNQQQQAYAKVAGRGLGRGGGGMGGGGGRGPGAAVAPVKVPDTEFDFQGNNARFDKLSGSPVPKAKIPEGLSGAEGAEGPEEGEIVEKEKSGAYNPSKSFFDELTPGPVEASGGGRGRGRGGRGGAMSRRDEERQKNFATFGEAGGNSGYGGGDGGWRGGRGGYRGGGGYRGAAPGGGAQVPRHMYAGRGTYSGERRRGRGGRPVEA